MGGPTHTPIDFCSLRRLLDWGRRLTQILLKFFPTSWRARREGPAGVSNQCGLASFEPAWKHRQSFDRCSLQEQQQRSPYIYMALRSRLFDVPPLVRCSNHQHDKSSSRIGCSCRTTSSQIDICLRTRSGKNALPPAPASHAGACHGNCRSRPLHWVPKVSAETESVGEGWRIDHASTHPRPSAENCGIKGRIGCGQAWR